ncbi:MAG: glycosyltransferase, partial [Atopostipes suicloacalis]|nr:glycosyltransferase [Atopostipes suicloacalis]
MKYTKDYTLSILTPTYNRAYTLDNLFRSLIGQLDKDLTWVVVDDGSTDNTEELIS